MPENSEKRESRYEIAESIGVTKTLAYFAIAISVAALLVSAYAILRTSTATFISASSPSSSSSSSAIPPAQFKAFNISSSLITPSQSPPAGAPVITQEQPFGSRLTNINSPLNASELAVINNAPNSYFEIAGEMLLNGSIKNEVGASHNKVPMFIVNGKPSVIYLGSITCIFCGENRWAMALALSRFGNFSALYKGYSSFGDGDLPTLYWAPASYNSSGKDDLGNFYSSKYINFISIDDENPITAGFALNPIQVIQSNVNATGNTAYIDALSYIINDLGKNASTAFSGTPYTIWGEYQVGGADAIDFGNSTPSSSSNLPLASMTHAQVLAQFANFNDQFAYTEYAAADLYVAMVCSSINNAAPVCSLPAIGKLESAGY
ncbi:MAG: DUF929 family protein [Candidatus Micrarchaeaceae archaeon]